MNRKKMEKNKVGAKGLDRLGVKSKHDQSISPKKNSYQKPTNCVQSSTAFSPLTNLEAMGALNLSQIAIKIPKKHWGNKIVSGRLGMIVAPRGAGKSTFIGALALSMGYKANFLGFEPRKQRRVIVLDGEMDSHTMQERLIEQSQALGVHIDNTHLKFVSPELFNGIMPSLSTTDGNAKSTRRWAMIGTSFL
jgi:hypothetical protein